MATERLISANAAAPEEEQVNWSLRPTSMAEYVGQTDLIERLKITIQACLGRGDPMEHLLLHGPPGLGKTTLAHIIATEMGTRAHVTSGPALTKPGDLVGSLMRLQRGDILFIDEIHRLPIAVEEFIYSAMEDFRIDITTESGMHAKTIQFSCKPFTLIGATTRAGLISAPLRSRFGLIHHLRYYSTADLVQILRRSCSLLGVDPRGDGPLSAIADRSRGTPRITNRLLRRVRDYAQVKAGGEISPKIVDAALKLESVDALGLDELDRMYIRTIASVYQGGPVGLEAVAATLNEDAGTLEDVVEPYLLQIGFLARTRRGRMLTRAAAEHVGLKWTPPKDAPQADLFTGEGPTGK